MSNTYQGHQARKRFGQNFLVDPAVIAWIIQAIRPKNDHVIVEIGPGLGALTGPLLQHVKHLHVVELDRDLIKRLGERFGESLTIHSGDALLFDFLELAQSLGQSLRIVGNLPYNISSPLLFHLKKFANVIEDQYFMLQKEVVERMTAKPGTKNYGRMTVMLQHCYAMEKIIDVPPGAFKPAPNVDSAVVRMIPHEEIKTLDAMEMKTLSDVVTSAFSQRRKILRNTLKIYLKDIEQHMPHFDLDRRAEEVSVPEYVALATVLGGVTLPSSL